MTDFEEFPKIPRLSRAMWVTEKLDGTNAQVCITKDEQGVFTVRAGSRNRWITPEDDNYGFARWVKENQFELLKLGEGRHYGEWWGQGIQRKYNLKEKRFSLFNTKRWSEMYRGHSLGYETAFPKCCHVVPVIYHGDFSQPVIDQTLEDLRVKGSVASPGFMKPEGIIIYHAAAGMFFKKTIDKDNEPKSLQGKNE